MFDKMFKNTKKRDQNAGTSKVPQSQNKYSHSDIIEMLMQRDEEIPQVFGANVGIMDNQYIQ
jgi:hypothetical protein